MKTIPVCLIPLLLLLSGVAAFSQPSPVLEEYIRQGFSNNLALQQQNLDLQKSLEAVRQARSLFYPTVQFNASYTMATGGRKIDFPIGDLLNPVYSTLNDITQTNQFPMLENQQIQFLPNNFQETYLKVAYPLFNSDLRYNRQIQEQMVVGKTAQKAAYEHELRYRITEAYLQYLQTLEAEKIWLHSKEVLTELRRFNESLVKNNVATRDVVATAEYELSKAEQEIFQFRSRQNTARAYFNFLINRDLQTDVTVDTTLLRQSVQAYQRDQLIADALDKRQELSVLRAGQSAAELALKLNEANRILPDAYIGAQAGFQGFGYKFNGDQTYVLAQVGLTYDIFNGGQTKSKIQQARIDSEKVRTQYHEAQQQIALQATQAWNEFEAARNAWITSQQGQRAAEETFRIVNNKYRAGQALLIEFLEAQNRVTAARLQVLLAWTDVLVREAQLRKAAGL
ncbi:MAG: TolC family protein [Thermoanaerobaculia bacterium]|nr:TolC family protein [Thermoanaerobaculia bacterium]